MFETYITAYPWDLIDDDLPTVLDRLQGEVGVSGVSVRMSTPALTRLRVRDVEPRVFRTRGGVYFPFNEERYQNTRCKPILSSWAKPKDPLTKIATACDERGLKLRIKLSASRTGRIAQRQPEMACKNVFGDPSEESLCLSNLDVQSFLGSLVEEISTRHALAAVSLTDFHTAWAEAIHNSEIAGRRLVEVEQYLLGMCFCESCRQKANAASVDIVAAKDTAQRIVQERLDGQLPSQQSVDAVLENHPELAAYQTWRGQELSTLLNLLQENCSCSLFVDRPVSGVLQSMQGGLQCGDVGVIHQYSTDDSIATVESHATRGHGLRLPGSFAIGSQAQPFVQAFTKAAEHGISSIEMEDHGTLSEPAFDTIRQAIRFARRSVAQ